MCPESLPAAGLKGPGAIRPREPPPRSLHLNYRNDCVIISRALISSPQGGYMVHAARATTASSPAPLSTRHFLIASFSAISAPAPHLTHHYSRTEPFLFDTNKPHKIIIPMTALLKTKEKQFSIRYKFALRKINSVSPVAGTQNVRNFRCHSNAAVRSKLKGPVFVVSELSG